MSGWSEVFLGIIAVATLATAVIQIAVLVAAGMLTRRLGLSDAEWRSVHFGALLHDIGKIRLPPELLNTDKPVSEDELALIRQHPVLGMEMLKPSSVAGAT